MANFSKSLALLLTNEAGYINDPDDPGGETYKGIARKKNPQWPGWAIIDGTKHQPGFPDTLYADAKLNSELLGFYKSDYWDKLRADQIEDQSVANSIFDFAVNTGVVVSVELAQKVVKEKQDGILGPSSLASINAMASAQFLALFAIEKIARYISIVSSKPRSKKFFYGWVKRALQGLS